jgi:hypothetical protein
MFAAVGQAVPPAQPVELSFHDLPQRNSNLSAMPATAR